MDATKEYNEMRKVAQPKTAKVAKEHATIDEKVFVALLHDGEEFGRALGILRIAYVKDEDGNADMSRGVIAFDCGEVARTVDVGDKAPLGAIGRDVFADSGRNQAVFTNADGDTLNGYFIVQECNRVYKARAESLGKKTNLRDK